MYVLKILSILKKKKKKVVQCSNKLVNNLLDSSFITVKNNFLKAIWSNLNYAGLKLKLFKSYDVIWNHTNKGDYVTKRKNSKSAREGKLYISSSLNDKFFLQE